MESGAVNILLQPSVWYNSEFDSVQYNICTEKSLMQNRSLVQEKVILALSVWHNTEAGTEGDGSSTDQCLVENRFWCRSE